MGYSRVMQWYLQISVALAALSDYYVSGIPNTESIELPEMYSGSVHVPTHGHTEPMFFWLYESKYRTTKPKTLIWLNGGPGCSSLDGALLEIGPLRYLGGEKFQYNKGNWGEYMNILYLDQPLGTGYSFLNDPSDSVADVEEAAALVDEFLKGWLKEFPHHAHDEFYFGGESYAGQYIPYIQKEITAVETKGIILANPWIDVAHQYLSYLPFVKESGILDEELLPKLEELHRKCTESLQSYQVIPSDVPACNQITTFILEHTGGNGRCINVYNYKLSDTFPACGMNWPQAVKDMPHYLNRDDVLDALHVNKSLDANKWVECSKTVGKKFRNFNKPTASTLLPELLAEVPILIMVGDVDFICNYKGIDDMVSGLSWGGQDPTVRGWLPDEQRQNITLDGKVVGSHITGRNLTLARIYDGSHMIPVDKQFETRALLHWFTGVTKEIGGKAPLEEAPATSPDDGEESDPESQEATDARKNAYKRAGIIALVIIIIMIVVLMLWLVLKGDVHLSWSHITSGFARALLHVGNPKIRKPFEYVSLDSFRPSGVPSTIIEEEEEDGFTV